MNKTPTIFLSALTIAILFSLPITLQDASAEGRNAPTKVSCTRVLPPVVPDTHQHNVTSETTFSAVIDIVQKQGYCWYMGGNAAHLYQVPYMPLKYEVEVFDRSFPDQVLHKVVITNIMDEEFSISVDNISVDIEFGIRVTSFFMNEFNNTVTVQGQTTCYQKDPLEIDHEI